MSDMAIMAGGALLVSWGLVYGRRWILPGSFARCLLYGFSSCVVVGTVWLRVLPLLGLQQPSVGEQWAAMAAITLMLRWGMDFLNSMGVE